MAHDTPNADSAESDQIMADVWSRTGSKYRRRAFVLLIINVCLFAGLGCVAYWLRTGVVFAPRVADYWDLLAATFHPFPDTKFTPTGLSLAPISIEQVPMMILVHGLILAALVSIPVLVAMLYRLPCSIPFIGVVGFIAVMPWLAIALVGSCLLASVKPFRFRSRFASALMGLLPVILYFFMASRQQSSTVDVLTDPADRIKLLAPLMLAIIVSAFIMGIVLVIAKIVNYRPGAIAPLLAILFLTPAALFEFQVGRDELHYRLLEQDFGPGSRYFISQDIREAFAASVEREWKRTQDQGRSYSEVRDALELRWSAALDGDAGQLFTEFQESAARAADRFVRVFPDSIYACNALYLKGRALDMRVDLGKFRHDREIVFYDDFPNRRSRMAWEKVEHHAPKSSMAAVALLRLAELDAREGKIDSAIQRLTRLEDQFGDRTNISDAVPSESTDDGIMTRKSPESSLHIPVAPVVFSGKQLLHLLRNNRDPLYGDAPLVDMLLHDPSQRRYATNVRTVLQRYPGCQLEDNIELATALAIPNLSAKIEALHRLTMPRVHGDSLPIAVYQLGLAHQENADFPKAREAFERVVSEFRESIWREPAELRLRQLDLTAPRTGVG